MIFTLQGLSMTLVLDMSNNLILYSGLTKVFTALPPKNYYLETTSTSQPPILIFCLNNLLVNISHLFGT